jgi:hypothetical protein
MQRMNRLVLTFLGVVILVGYGFIIVEKSLAAQETILFFDGFEDGLEKWQAVPGGPRNRGEASTEIAYDGKYSLKTTGGDSTGYSMTVFADEPKAVRVEVWFYDDWICQRHIAGVGTASDITKLVVVGFQHATVASWWTNYYVAPYGRIGWGQAVVTEARRSEGWQKFEWVFDGKACTIYINDIEVFTDTNVGKANIIALGTAWGTNAQYMGDTGYWDNIKVTLLE